MGIKQYKPTTPSLRYISVSDFAEITKSKPEKSLTRPLKKTGGRNNTGRLTIRHHGGGHKQKYRVIDFRRDRLEEKAKVIAVEYDPNRSARIALVEYADKERRYIICPLGLKVGEEIISSDNPETEMKPGNALPLKLIPLGTLVHNVEFVKGRGGQLVRSAGSSAQLNAKEGEFALLKLPSSEIRYIHLNCRATIGQIGNVENESLVIGKAGRTRWMGVRPTVRGLAMNPIDHPHGGGEGKSGQGNPHPVSKWGMPTKGYKTRRGQKYSDKFILKRRNDKNA